MFLSPQCEPPQFEIRMLHWSFEYRTVPGGTYASVPLCFVFVVCFSLSFAGLPLEFDIVFCQTEDGDELGLICPSTERRAEADGEFIELAILADTWRPAGCVI